MFDLDDLKRYLSDLPLIVLVILFAGVVAAFINGILKYPLGWLVLIVLIYLRIAHIQRKKGNKEGS
ncbi:MAG: hypothetical protein WCA08_17405 [Desulfoferrobacter sp.]